MFYVAESSFWSTISFSVTSALSFILVIAFANLLPREAYGTYKYIMSLAGSLGFLTLTGMNTAVTQAVARGHNGIVKYSVRLQLRWNLLFVAGLLILAGYYLIQDNRLFAITLGILAFSLPFTAAFNTYGAFLAGKKEFKKGAIYAVVSSSIYVVVMLSALFLTKNLAILVAVYAFGNLLPAILIYFHIIKLYRLEGWEKKQEQDLFRYGGHLSIVNIFSTISQYIDKIVVFRYLGAVQLAIYALAIAAPERLRGLTKNISSILLPKLSSKTLTDIKPVFYQRTFQGMAVGALISLVYILLAPLFFKLLLPQYLDSIRYSQVFSINFIFTIPASYMSSVMRSQKMIGTIYLSSVSANISRITLFILFGYFWGIWGIICASILIYAVGLVYNFLLWEAYLKKQSLLH